jgi:tetratricopeptide (TPR) repeat protein
VPDPDSAYLGAVERINAGEFDTAILELRTLLAAIGPTPDVLNYLGYAHRQRGRFDESLAYYQQALALDPNHLGANEYLGELYVELGHIELARERLALLDGLCPFGCAEYEDLKRRIESRIVASR